MQAGNLLTATNGGWVADGSKGHGRGAQQSKGESRCELHGGCVLVCRWVLFSREICNNNTMPWLFSKAAMFLVILVWLLDESFTCVSTVTSNVSCSHSWCILFWIVSVGWAIISCSSLFDDWRHHGWIHSGTEILSQELDSISKVAQCHVRTPVFSVWSQALVAQRYLSLALSKVLRVCHRLVD